MLTPTLTAVAEVLLLLPGLAEPAAGAARKGVGELAGTWQAVTYALDGKAASAEDQKKIQLLIDRDGKARAELEGKTFIAGTIKADPGKTPKTMDITYTQGQEKGKTSRAIYKIEGDRLTICRSAAGSPRPTAFASEPGSGHTLMTYRRVKRGD